MKILFCSLAIILHLLAMMMHLAAARSLPSIEQMTGETHREELSPNLDTISEVAQLQTELAELFIPSYLKDMYINLTFPNGVAHPSSNPEETKVNTIQSYKNQAKSK